MAVGPLLTCMKKNTGAAASSLATPDRPWPRMWAASFSLCQEALGQRHRGLGQRSGGALIGFQLRHWLSHRLLGSWTCLSARQYPWPELRCPGLPQTLPLGAVPYSSPSLWTWLLRSRNTAHASVPFGIDLWSALGCLMSPF